MTTNPINWDQDLPPETEAEVYQALLRALKRKQGFGLFFVQCSPAQGKKILADLRRDLSEQQIQELALQGEVTNLYNHVKELWQKQPFDVLVIEGLQASLYAYEDTKRLAGWSSSDIYNYSWKGVPKILNHLNQHREKFRDDFPARFVFLVPPFVVDYFIQRASDFLDWRSGLFRFPRDPHIISQSINQLMAEGEHNQYLALSPSERVEKILRLKDLQEACLDLQNKTHLLRELGRLFFIQQDYENAFISLDKALYIEPNNGRNWFMHGLALSSLERYEEAIDSFDKALTTNPSNHNVWMFRGLALSAEGSNEAIANFDRALSINPNDYNVWLNRGLGLAVLGRYEEAINSFDKALNISPDFYEVWKYYGLTLSNLGRYEEAITNYEKALKIKPDDDETWCNRGKILLLLGRHDQALVSFEVASEINPSSDNAWNLHGLLLSFLGREQEALVSLDKALKINPNLYEAWLIRGHSLLTSKSYQEAIVSYDKVLQINSADNEALVFRGAALSCLGRFKEALTCLDKALEIAPSDFIGLHLRAG